MGGSRKNSGQKLDASKFNSNVSNTSNADWIASEASNAEVDSSSEAGSPGPRMGSKGVGSRRSSKSTDATTWASNASRQMSGMSEDASKTGFASPPPGPGSGPLRVQRVLEVVVLRLRLP